MEPAELRRLVVRHRHVAPMLSVVLATTDASVRITDVDGEVILDRQPATATAGTQVERHPIVDRRRHRSAGSRARARRVPSRRC